MALLCFICSFKSVCLSETLERFNKLKTKKVSLEDLQLEIKQVKQEIVYRDRIVKFVYDEFPEIKQVKQEIVQLKDVNKQLEDKNLKLEDKNNKLEDRVAKT